MWPETQQWLFLLTDLTGVAAFVVLGRVCLRHGGEGSWPTVGVVAAAAGVIGRGPALLADLEVRFLHSSGIWRFMTDLSDLSFLLAIIGRAGIVLAIATVVIGTSQRRLGPTAGSSDAQSVSEPPR